MKWLLPAKTFLLGEYAAVDEASAIVLTTLPCFELTLNEEKRLQGIHPDSPAGLWWHQQKHKNHGLIWSDPYKGCGGLGASSAQFLGAYLASCYLKNKVPTVQEMLNEYYQVSWTGTGLRPSGYDVLAQSQSACVFINKQKHLLKSYPWVFKDLSFILLHTGTKLATHNHLQDSTLPTQIEFLSTIVDEAQKGFEQGNSDLLISAINQYHQKLTELNLVAQHSLELIRKLKAYPEVKAIKGCGALGADVLLILTASKDLDSLTQKCLELKLSVLATEGNLTLNTNSLICPPFLSTSS